MNVIKIPSSSVTSDPAWARGTHQIGFWLRVDCVVVSGVEICVELIDDLRGITVRKPIGEIPDSTTHGISKE